MKKRIIFLNILIILVFPFIKIYSSPDYYISRENFTKFADKVVWYNANGIIVQNNDIIFVNAVHMDNFFNNVYPNIKNKFILITHGSDKGIPGKFSSVLEDDKLIAWFGENVENFSHEKLFHIPIGIGYSFYNCDTKILDQIRQKPINKKYLAYMNFNSGTHRERREVYALFHDKPFCYNPKRYEIDQFDKYLEDLASSCFVLSPRGTGLDCFRTWEALYMGSIPVVKTSSLDPLFEDLPVLIIDDWKSVTEEFLREKYKEMEKKRYNLEKLNMSYWRNLIISFKLK